MSLNKGIRSVSSRRRPFSSPSSNKKRHSEQISTTTTTAERKMRSLQNLQERLCFTLKRPRTRRHNNRGGHRDGYGGFKQARPHRVGANSTLMESGLIQIPYLQCEYYESPSPLSISSCLSQESVATTTTTSSSCYTTATASSTISHVSASHSPISPLEYNSSDDGFSSDEVMSLVSCCPDMVMHNVLDFMPYPSPRRPDTFEERVATTASAGRTPPPSCESKAATPDHTNFECPISSVEDDGEPYRIDLCDFEPDVNALHSPSTDGSNHQQKNDGGGVLCLRLDYDEVLRAWKERGECLISREPMYYTSPFLDPLHSFGYTSFVPHPPYF
ncbi:hypothetical protein GOP47_0014116 [Adiantum capillus-veneris]|uniref:Uncharacterized protein n=1 Tax=Adiantum capillus-veneris TaxID=13818 RepID=A0A9D4UPT4_ADICA|nr:hypothetical protein GOP47_0014116 [Adiantum capillus-veneris]